MPTRPVNVKPRAAPFGVFEDHQEDPEAASSPEPNITATISGSGLQDLLDRIPAFEHNLQCLTLQMTRELGRYLVCTQVSPIRHVSPAPLKQARGLKLTISASTHGVR